MHEPDGLEVELKLQLAPEDLDALATSFDGSAAVTSKAMRATYFDTPDRLLRDAGLSLRIRTTDRSRIQTMKAEGSALGGLLARPEWERPAAGRLPDLSDAPDAMRALLPASLEGLAPAFTVDVTRRTTVVEHDGARVEVAIDSGTVTAAGRSTIVAEVEFELEDGPPAALFALARQAAAVVPVRLGVLTKSERGYRLLDGTADRPSNGERGTIPLRGDVADAFGAIAGACLRQFRLNEDLLLATGSSDALHQARVALRRLRSALSIFRRAVADDRFDRLRVDLRWLSALLGEARDIDVLIERTGEHVLFDPARSHAYARVMGGLASTRARALELDLAEWLAVGAWRTGADNEARSEGAATFASAKLDQVRGQLKRRGKRLDRLDDEGRHVVRILAKKLRYAAEFFADLYPKPKRRRRARRFVAAVQELQRHLGDLNDLATAPLLLARLGVLAPPGSKPDKRAMIAAAAEAYDELVERKPFWR